MIRFRLHLCRMFWGNKSFHSFIHSLCCASDVQRIDFTKDRHTRCVNGVNVRRSIQMKPIMKLQ